jgi:acyl-CoA synthetase (NDP forming)
VGVIDHILTLLLKNAVAKRFLNLHEYQSQELMRKHGILVPNGFVAHTAEEAEAAAKKLCSCLCLTAS